MQQVLTNYDVSANLTSSTIAFSRHRPWTTWLWKITFNGGSGTNQIKITPKAIANYQADAASEELFDLVDASAWQGPRLITDAMITAAPSSTFKAAYSTRAQWDVIRLDFNYSGGGSRVFRFNLWVGND